MSIDKPPAASPAQAATGDAIDTLLGRLRQELRGAIGRRLAWQGAAAVGITLWLGLTFDRLLEPSASVRLGAGVGLVSLLAAWLAVVVVPRLARRISDRDLITLLHHKHPSEAGSLATALDLRASDDFANPQLAAESIHAANEAAKSLTSARLSRSSGSMGLAWFASVALGGALLLGVARPDLTSCLVSRIALSERPWPRRIELLPEGFTFDESSGVWSLIAVRGEPLEFSLVAETSPEHTLPRTVWARGVAARRRTLTTLTRVGEPIVGETKRQRFRRRIERLDADQTLIVSGGDATLRVRLVAADRPQLVQTQITCLPPAYRDEPSFTVRPSTLSPLPEGSRVTVSAATTKPIESIEARVTLDSKTTALTAKVGEDQRTITLTPPRLAESCLLTVTVTDTDGLRSEPVEIPLESAPDSPPTVRLTLDGVGRAITRDARLPVVATLDDDHGLAEVGLRIQSDGGRQTILPMPTPIALPGDVTATADLISLRSAGTTRLAVEPGDRVTLQATARDRYDLTEREPSISQAIVLEVITDAELLARLGDAQRELRRGIESLLADVERLGYEIDLARRQQNEQEPTQDNRLTRWVSERLLDTRKASDGISAIVKRADGLRRQVVNNRLDQPALVDRLETSVVGPLRRVTTRDLPSVADRLKDLNPGPDSNSLDDALVSVRRAAETLERVAASLDSQQTYNEVVSLLRGLIREQRTVNERTARQQAEDARSLLLD